MVKNSDFSGAKSKDDFSPNKTKNLISSLSVFDFLKVLYDSKSGGGVYLKFSFSPDGGIKQDLVTFFGGCGYDFFDNKSCFIHQNEFYVKLPDYSFLVSLLYNEDWHFHAYKVIRTWEKENLLSEPLKKKLVSDLNLGTSKFIEKMSDSYFEIESAFMRVLIFGIPLHEKEETYLTYCNLLVQVYFKGIENIINKMKNILS